MNLLELPTDLLRAVEDAVIGAFESGDFDVEH